MSTFEKVRDITVEQLSVDADEVNMAFEEEFGVEIPDEKAEKIRTVADAVKLLDEEK